MGDRRVENNCPIGGSGIGTRSGISDGFQVQKRDLADLVGCVSCGRRELATGTVVCGRCRHDMAPTQVRLALDALGVTTLEAAEAAGVSRATIMSALAGVPVRGKKGRKLADHLGVNPEAVLLGEPAPAELREELLWEKS